MISQRRGWSAYRDEEIRKMPLVVDPDPYWTGARMAQALFCVVGLVSAIAMSIRW